jgi:hypothetical protein
MDGAGEIICAAVRDNLAGVTTVKAGGMLGGLFMIGGRGGSAAGAADTAAKSYILGITSVDKVVVTKDIFVTVETVSQRLSNGNFRLVTSALTYAQFLAMVVFLFYRRTSLNVRELILDVVAGYPGRPEV